MKLLTLLALLFTAALAGCEALLPRQRAETTSVDSFEAARASFDKVEVGKSREADLSALQIRPGGDGTVNILNGEEIARRFFPISQVHPEGTPDWLADCIEAGDACRAYEWKTGRELRERRSNFWADFLNFHRQVEIKSWQFNALFIVCRDVVTYKTWSGEPMNVKTEDSRNPLGPLQGLGEHLSIPH